MVEDDFGHHYQCEPLQPHWPAQQISYTSPSRITPQLEVTFSSFSPPYYEPDMTRAPILESVSEIMSAPASGGS